MTAGQCPGQVLRAGSQAVPVGSCLLCRLSQMGQAICPCVWSTYTALRHLGPKVSPRTGPLVSTSGFLLKCILSARRSGTHL